MLSARLSEHRLCIRFPSPADQDSVRLLAVEDCAALAKLLSREDALTNVMPAVQKFAQDKSWRVRYNVAQQLYSLCETVGPTVAR